MSSWFDRLLEELEQRQREADARREGRPLPWRRWLLIGGAVLALLFVLGLLGGVINLITDLMWYEALGRRDVLTTRLWSQVGLFVAGVAGFAIPAVVSIWVARRIA